MHELRRDLRRRVDVRGEAREPLNARAAIAAARYPVFMLLLLFWPIE